MDIPPPPPDTELRNIIDKLAQFVARNGPEFEQMTKNKQKGNPKFQFLYGGEFFSYYQFKVTAEQTMLKQQGGWSANPPAIQSPNHSLNHNPPPPIIPVPNLSVPPAVNVTEIGTIKTQVEALQEQIKQSEQNLQAQHAVLMQQQQAQVEVVITECENKANQLEADDNNISLLDLNQLLTPIVENCTKDSIQAGKSWILQHANSKEKALCIAHCLLLKVMQGSPAFNHRLHVIYLVNDVLHHCARKNASDIKDALESVVVPMFCTANLAATTDEQRNKLDKLLQLWESKANYLAPTTVDAMRRPQDSIQQYKQNQLTKFANEINILGQQTQVTFEGYRAQHQAFVMHATQQIQELEQRLGLMEEQIRMEEQCRVVEEPPPVVPPINPSVPPPQFTQPPPGFFSPPPIIPAVFPDFSKPPPGFPPVPEPPHEDLMPSVPYYELPAGLIVPLIKLEDTRFKPLDAKDIRLPPPAPPNERLLAAVEAFYALPSHERPRDSEGWEKLGLYEYYKAKNQAKKEKDDMIEAGARELSRSPSPVVITQEKSPSPPRRRYNSKSPSPHPRDSRRSRSRSRTPPRRRSERSERSERRSSRRRRTRSHSRSRSKSNSPNFRSSSMMNAISSLNSLDVIDSTNKGHQMLKRMGWGGSGLGLNEQGIDSPISGGDVRDWQDQFKGIGCNLNDPYENFRKNKGAAFITRMKARAEERAQEKQSKEDY